MYSFYHVLIKYSTWIQMSLQIIFTICMTLGLKFGSPIPWLLLWVVGLWQVMEPIIHNEEGFVEAMFKLLVEQIKIVWLRWQCYQRRLKSSVKRKRCWRIGFGSNVKSIFHLSQQVRTRPRDGLTVTRSCKMQYRWRFHISRGEQKTKLPN
jgi:hypothetical protein